MHNYNVSSILILLLYIFKCIKHFNVQKGKVMDDFWLSLAHFVSGYDASQQSSMKNQPYTITPGW